LNNPIRFSTKACSRGFHADVLMPDIAPSFTPACTSRGWGEAPSPFA
jgi:hypothetical protein